MKVNDANSQPLAAAATARASEISSPAPGVAPKGTSWIFAAALSTMFMAAIEGTIVATAMPTIVGALGGFELFSWVFSAYLLTQAVTIPIYGRLADVYGRKRILFVGIGLFLTGSVLSGFAWSMISLITFRVANRFRHQAFGIGDHAVGRNDDVAFDAAQSGTSSVWPVASGSVAPEGAASWRARAPRAHRR